MATNVRTKAHNSRKGRLHSDAPQNFWQGRRGTIAMGLEEFRVTVLRVGLPPLRLDDLVESVSWTEPFDSAITTGEIQYREPAYRLQPLVIRSGDRVRLDWSSWGQGRWKQVWTLRVDEPSASIKDGSRTLTLANDLLILSRSIDDFNYGKSKRRPRGWRVRDALIDVCGRYGVKLGRVPRLTHVIKKRHWLKTSPLRVINDLMLAQRNYTGHRYVTRFTNGKLNIVSLQRSRDLLMLGPALIDAALQESFSEQFATALTVRSSREVRSGKDATGSKRVTHRKIAVKIKSKAAIRRFGYVHRIVYAHGAESASEARTLGLRYLSKVARLQRHFTLTSDGVPTLHKGDAIRIAMPEVGIKQIIYVSEITQTVGPGSYTMDVSVIFSDPYVDKKAERVNELEDDPNATATSRKKKPAPAKNSTKKDNIPAPPKPSKGDELSRAGTH